MQPFPSKEPSDFSKPEVRHAFIERTEDGKSLLQKELDVNKEEQVLLTKRIKLMRSFLNDLPSSDPQYSMLALQIQMDQLEIDELKAKEATITQKLNS